MFPPAPLSPRRGATRRSTTFAFAAATFVLALLAASVAPAHASEPIAEPQPPRLELPEAFSVRAGDTVELRWSSSAPEIDELEIQLSLDDGRHWALRVSPELEAREGRYLWHVPHVLAENARMRVRYNLRGREMAGEATAPFHVMPAADSRDARHLRVASGSRAAEQEIDDSPVHEGVWWSGPRDFDAPGAAAALSPPSEQLTATGELPAATPPERDFVISREVSRRLAFMIAEVPAPALRLAEFDRTPESTPLRN